MPSGRSHKAECDGAHVGCHPRNAGFGISGAHRAGPNHVIELLVGTQGWSYADWVGPMYDPRATPQSYLTAYAAEFGTVEIDATFHSTPTPGRVRSWADRVPPEFRFSCKLDREVTHKRRLVGAEEAIRNFYDALRHLGPKLGCVLAQFDDTFGRDQEGLLLAALDAFPRDVRTAFEFRDPEWYDADVQTLLEERGFALAVGDSPFLPREVSNALLSWTEAEYAYIRLIGTRGAVGRFDAVQLDRTDDLAWWAQTVRSLPRRVGAVYVYANNHFEGHSPATARSFFDRLGVAHERAMGPHLAFFS